MNLEDSILSSLPSKPVHRPKWIKSEEKEVVRIKKPLKVRDSLEKTFLRFVPEKDRESIK